MYILFVILLVQLNKFFWHFSEWMVNRRLVIQGVKFIKTDVQYFPISFALKYTVESIEIPCLTFGFLS